MKDTVLCTSGKAYFRCNDTWTTLEDPNIYHVAIVPGLELSVTETAKRCYYIFAKDTTAVVFAVTTTTGGNAKVSKHFAKKLEIDLDVETLDYLDCQRDRDNNIVLLYGTMNHNTGSIDTNYFAWSEDDFTNRKIIPDPKETTKLPNRYLEGTKIDFRDHGNLISLLNLTNEKQLDHSRHFQFVQGIYYGNVLVPYEMPPGIRIVRLYGSPHKFIFLAKNGSFYEAVYDGSAFVSTKLDILKPNDVHTMKDITGLCVSYR
jgi:hypothetical protein